MFTNNEIFKSLNFSFEFFFILPILNNDKPLTDLYSDLSCIFIDLLDQKVKPVTRN